MENLNCVDQFELGCKLNLMCYMANYTMSFRVTSVCEQLGFVSLAHVCFKSFFLMSSPKENVMVIFDLLAGKEETVI